MRNAVINALFAGSMCTFGVAFAAAQSPSTVPTVVQGVDPAVWRLYHHTDQGTRLLPAAWMQALRMPDGSRLMDRANTERFGFISSDGPPTKLNPYGWPIGWTVSDPHTSDNIVVSGVTCAACHTGQLEYRGQKVRIEGGESMADIPGFEGVAVAALAGVANDPTRRAQFFKEAIAAGYPANRMDADWTKFAASNVAMLSGKASLTQALPGPGRVDAIQGIAQAVLSHDIDVPQNARSFDAPVSYPYLWDIWRLSWLQYNGFMPWPHPMSRNMGEVLGTSGRINLLDTTGALNPEPQRWQSSIQFDNLEKMEGTIRAMQAPVWPARLFGAIKAAQARQGRQLFTTNCSGCHGIKELPSGAWDVAVVELKHIGTDPNHAINWAGRRYDGTKLGLGPSIGAPATATVINAVRNQHYADAHVPANKREGDVTFGAACGYKARPLIGAWSTPPFLHNGSVRTVYDLLSESRPSSFGVGTRLFDPVRLGYVDDKRPSAYKFDASATGNSNAGHWWTDDANRAGRIGRKLSEPEKFAIIEFLKSATYANYPRIKVAQMAPVPCDNDPAWAVSMAK